MDLAEFHTKLDFVLDVLILNAADTKAYCTVVVQYNGTVCVVVKEQTVTGSGGINDRAAPVVTPTSWAYERARDRIARACHDKLQG